MVFMLCLIYTSGFIYICYSPHHFVILLFCYCNNALTASLLTYQTNDGSTVSKRSVERIYHPNDPQYLRFFVKKYQRRTPLVNRGYFLRMRLVDTMVSRFLSRPSGKTKVIVNLGCGR